MKTVTAWCVSTSSEGDLLAGRAGGTLQPVSSRPATTAPKIATRSQERARNLLSLATALSRSVTPDDVADAMFAEGLRALGADAGWLALVAESDDGALVVRMIRSSGYDSETENRYRLIAPQPGRPLSDAILFRRLVLVESRADWDARYPGQFAAIIEPTGYEALAALPVVVGHRALAGIVFAFRGPRIFDDDARTYLETIGQLCAQALDRARAFDAERRERERTQIVLGAIADACVAIDPEFRLTYLNDRAADLLGKPIDSIVGTRIWEALSGVEDAEFGRLLRDAMETRRATEYETYVAPIERWLAVRAFPSEDGGLVVFLQDITRGRRARDASEFLVEASRVLASSLDYETTLQNLASAAVPRIADWCSIDMLQSPGDRSWPPTLRRVALTHQNPQRVALVERLRERVRTDWSSPSGLPRVLREGVSEYTPDITDEIRRATATSDEHLEMLRELALSSVIIVPLAARGRLLGALTVCMAESQRRYEMSDLVVIEELARRAGTAIDNALLYNDALDAQRTAVSAAERTRRLQTLTAAMARALSEQEVLDIIVEQAIVAVGAQAGIVMLLSGDGTLRPARSVGYPREALAALQEIPADAPYPVREALRGEPVFLATAEEWNARYAPPIWKFSAKHAAAFLPLDGGGQPFGALSIRFAESHEFEADEREFLVALAQQCGQALERAHLLTAERAARTEAEDANRAKMEFLATMSHELRTPLNAIGGYAELIEMGVRGPVTALQRHDLQRIQRSQEQLLSLINDVLNFAKLEAGKVEFNTRAIDVRETVDALEPLLAPQLAAKQLTLQSVDRTTTVRAIADEDKLRQVLLNLLSNAVKFTPDGGQIILSCAHDERQVYVRVQDTGIGIPTQYLGRIFDPFVQLERRLTNVVSGTGLGLAISRDLARAMGGDVTVESAPGSGSTFTVALKKAE
jgi:signal transduction histidine kinase/PAS domain-containing protein